MIRKAEPLVSIIMPTYNHGHLIGDAIRSIIKQSYSIWELIIINNHSEDDTSEVIKSFNDERIQEYFIHNKGIIAASRNYGIKLSSGKYVAFLDSDDLWLPQKLEKQIDFITASRNIEVCATNGFNMVDGEILNKPILSYPKKEILFKEMINGLSVINSSVLVKRDVLFHVGLLDECPKIQFVEDTDLWVRIAIRSSIGYLKQPLVIYRYHSGNDYQIPLAHRNYMFKKWLDHGIVSRRRYIRLIKHQVYGLAWHINKKQAVKSYLGDIYFWIWLLEKIKIAYSGRLF